MWVRRACCDLLWLVSGKQIKKKKQHFAVCYLLVFAGSEKKTAYETKWWNSSEKKCCSTSYAHGQMFTFRKRDECDGGGGLTPYEPLFFQ